MITIRQETTNSFISLLQILLIHSISNSAISPEREIHWFWSFQSFFFLSSLESSHHPFFFRPEFLCLPTSIAILFVSTHSVVHPSVRALSQCMAKPNKNALLLTNGFFIVFCHSHRQFLGFRGLDSSLLLVQAEHYILQAISIRTRPSRESFYCTHDLY